MKLTSQELYDLFINREDVFAVQSKKGGYFPVKRKIEISDIDKHLLGDITLGVYCLDKDSKVKWGCVDLDGDDLVDLKKKATIIFNLFSDFKRMLEFSGRRGYHVWIFLEKKQSAEYIKTMIRSRLGRVSLNNYEVFPKQTCLNETRQYGNLVKLPLGKHLGSGKFSEIIKIKEVKE